MGHLVGLGAPNGTSKFSRISLSVFHEVLIYALEAHHWGTWGDYTFTRLKCYTVTTQNIPFSLLPALEAGLVLRVQALSNNPLSAEFAKAYADLNAFRQSTNEAGSPCALPRGMQPAPLRRATTARPLRVRVVKPTRISGIEKKALVLRLNHRKK